LVGNLKRRDHSLDLDVDGRIRLNLREIGWEGMDWILLAQDRNQWRALVKTEMNFRVP
jgi:hypothetical protein